ncbi:MAG: hypothetical protein LBG63_05100 [Candidatus Methanoplasma sp.]|jgi:sulfur carrier protein|nr:hypothetical protein [Candidatus Methanoplasma sp.]
MSAKITIGGKEHDVPCGSTICDAVRTLGFAPDAFIFMADGKPVPMDTAMIDGTAVKTVKVASGG